MKSAQIAAVSGSAQREAQQALLQSESQRRTERASHSSERERREQPEVEISAEARERRERAQQLAEDRAIERVAPQSILAVRFGPAPIESFLPVHADPAELVRRALEGRAALVSVREVLASPDSSEREPSDSANNGTRREPESGPK